MITVVKYKDHKHNPECTYIGRGSPLGNPYAMKVDTEEEREAVIKLFKEHMMLYVKIPDSNVRKALIDLYRREKNGENILLGCFCAPKACHGNVIKEFIEEMVAIE